MSKAIVLFIDGTWNDAEGPAATNVLALCRRLQAYQDVGPQRLVWHYIAGVGSARPARTGDRRWTRWFQPTELAAQVKRVAQHVAGGAAGYGTASRIKEAYKFLTDHYLPGDQIFLFGFSRGAFAVRSLACFIDQVGLLLQANIAEVESAYLLYEQSDGALRARLRRLGLPTRPDKEARTVLPLHMIGVWDSVRRLGLPAELQWLPRSYTGYHQTSFPAYVSHIRHALALHEVRAMFEPLLWDEPVTLDKSLQQVWFAGAHADVGGGYRDRALADASLAWMMAEARALGLPIEADPAPPTLHDAAALAHVHHELRGKFFFTRPRVRQQLLALQKGGVEHLGDWSVHVSATDRLVSLPLQRYVLGRFDVADAFHEVDRLTGILAMKMACAWDVLPSRDPPVSDAPQPRNGPPPEPTGMSGAEWQDFSIGELHHALALLRKLEQGEADILDLDKPALQRALMLDAVFCEPPAFLKLAERVLQLKDECLCGGDAEVQAAIARLRRLADCLTLPDAVRQRPRHHGLPSVAAMAGAVAALGQIDARRALAERRNGTGKPVKHKIMKV